MSYGYFAEFYDSFTDDVNYDKIEKFVGSLLSREGINGGLLLDLACGTGSLAVRLSEKGYSVIDVYKRQVETVSRSLHHSCGSELTRQGISLP